VAVALKTDLRLPGEVAWPILAALILGILIPIAAFALLRMLTPPGCIDRGAMAAHYGSTSLVTLTAALVLLEGSAIAFEGYVLPSWRSWSTLAVMSVGGAMVLGVLCASASYIAAPAAVRLALPEVRPSITLVSSLGIAFPCNLVVQNPVNLTDGAGGRRVGRIGRNAP